MKQKISSEANRFSGSQEIPLLYGTRKCSHELDEIRFTLISSYLRLGLSNGLFPSGFLTIIIYVFKVSLINAMCFAQLNFHDVIIIAIYDEEYKL
jgi:hypothetical protein